MNASAPQSSGDGSPSHHVASVITTPTQMLRKRHAEQEPRDLGLDVAEHMRRPPAQPARHAEREDRHPDALARREVEIEAHEEDEDFAEDRRREERDVGDRAAFGDRDLHRRAAAEDALDLILQAAQSLERLLEVDEAGPELLPDQRRPRDPLAERHRERQDAADDQDDEEQDDDRRRKRPAKCRAARDCRRPGRTSARR